MESFKAGESNVLRRNETWDGVLGGKLPYFRRIISQTVPSRRPAPT